MAFKDSVLEVRRILRHRGSERPDHDSWHRMSINSQLVWDIRGDCSLSSPLSVIITRRLDGHDGFVIDLYLGQPLLRHGHPSGKRAGMIQMGIA